jgi:hypothetical protein
MAQSAFDQFQALGMNYETARSLASLAMAKAQPGRATNALAFFAEAREMFVREEYLVWPRFWCCWRWCATTRHNPWPAALSRFFARREWRARK